MKGVWKMCEWLERGQFFSLVFSSFEGELHNKKKKENEKVVRVLYSVKLP